MPPSGLRAVEAAVGALYNCGMDDPGPAVQELLITLLAATLITPPDNAVSRARHAAALLIALVEEGVSLKSK